MDSALSNDANIGRRCSSCHLPVGDLRQHFAGEHPREWQGVKEFLVEAEERVRSFQAVVEEQEA